MQETIKTYASATAPKQNQSPSPDESIRQVIKTIRKEEKVEERETVIRSKIIIIHGKPDAPDNQEDQKSVAGLIEDLHTNVTVKQVVRIGQPAYGKKRPIKISFESEEEKFKKFKYYYLREQKITKM